MKSRSLLAGSVFVVLMLVGGCEVVAPDERLAAATCAFSKGAEAAASDTAAHVPLWGLQWMLVGAITDTTVFTNDEIAAIASNPPHLVFERVYTTGLAQSCRISFKSDDVYTLRGHTGCNQGLGCYRETPCVPDGEGGCEGTLQSSFGTTLMSCGSRPNTLNHIVRRVMSGSDPAYVIRGYTLTVTAAPDAVLCYEAEPPT